jgi:hypothetical protein
MITEGQRPQPRRIYQRGSGSRDAAEPSASTSQIPPGFLAAEIAMASANCEAPIVTRTQAEKLLDLYFGLVEQAVPWIEINPLERRS